MPRTLVTAPSAEPVSLAEAKEHLRVTVTDEDTLILALIQAAREQAELITRRALVTQTWDYFLTAWPTSRSLDLPLPPLQSVTSVKYTDADGIEATVDPADYSVDTASFIGRIVLNPSASWPGVSLHPTNPIAVRFEAGYGDAAAVPASIKAAMLLMIGHLFDHREDSITGTIISKLPNGAEALLTPYRVVEL